MFLWYSCDTDNAKLWYRIYVLHLRWRIRFLKAIPCFLGNSFIGMRSNKKCTSKKITNFIQWWNCHINALLFNNLTNVEIGSNWMIAEVILKSFWLSFWTCFYFYKNQSQSKRSKTSATLCQKELLSKVLFSFRV